MMSDAYVTRKDDCDAILESLELSDMLDRLQAEQNNGRGVSCIQLVTTYLRRGEWAAATVAARTEFDKMDAYPEIAKIVVQRILNTEWDRRTRESIYGNEWGIWGAETPRPERRKQRL